jgi:hypothetical protein
VTCARLQAALKARDSSQAIASDQIVAAHPGQLWQIHRAVVVSVEAIATATRDETGKVELTLRGNPAKLVASRLYAHLFKAMCRPARYQENRNVWPSPRVAAFFNIASPSAMSLKLSPRCQNSMVS